MLTLTLLVPGDPQIETIWRALEQTARPCFFLSWGWMETWLACLDADERPSLAVVRDPAPVAAFFLAHRRERRHVAFPSRAVYVNTSGIPARDELCVEHNAILRAAESKLTFAEILELLDREDGGRWDELFMPGVDRDELAQFGPVGSRYRMKIDREAPAPYVDLAKVRDTEGGYLSLLSSSTRGQLRRARRKVSPLEIEIARDERHAMDIYNELVRLHGQRWHQRGEQGAFADPWFDQFHRRLIAHRLPHGEIQLVRVRSGAATIGCLYNFVYRGRVLFYQSGLERFADPHIKPGYLCHAAAIEHGAAAGLDVYDLLAGDARYKHSLATDETRLLWVHIQRHLTRFRIEDRLRDLKHAFDHWRQRKPTSAVPSRA